jgi:hypothetical protein
LISDLDSTLDFGLGLNFEKLIVQVDDHEFAVCIFTSGDGLVGDDTGRQATPGQPDPREVAEGRQRQLSRLAADPVSGGLARIELSRKKRNAAQAEYHRLAASV